MKFLKSACIVIGCIFILTSPQDSFAQTDSKQNEVEQKKDLTEHAVIFLTLMGKITQEASTTAELPKEGICLFPKKHCPDVKPLCEISCEDICEEAQKVCDNGCPNPPVPDDKQKDCKAGCDTVVFMGLCPSFCNCAKTKDVCNCS
ncbi:MAG: hypothetical protein ACD_16C00250G0006 [uncultured bacterium]|nr:MAG: hypothetical protein ACD_16C00250G0006 [uncultured bacterium]OFW68553.1 MAG: hypothetical protein A2X70_02410 [Alphaproteobacteria bacterium GWC2_42_16]OFW73170.1 MAG: hypothetical protein A2Z80_01065 [Alphaproteobacteria bacterium GWA2_41_27]OFW81718.1 MAG: hypothetical protein A3E50_01980 [Alphaproteobacteria bacterium RIFCSPHIGHO2_12_FULL_42_100]OFW90618.1 MAG: hypothetical protein A3C41_00390 [Alphaproteobacteria bacterium RIFCSPHIGHO2_02_FULL_42_30]OFW93360.1 MAG: hypothetical pro